jgi:uncharacterized membrane protein
MSREQLHRSQRFGDRASDLVVGAMGSWKFILIQTALVVAWVTANAWLLSRPYDPFPFLLLNIAFSTQAAYASPLILMSQNRQSAKDHARDDLESVEVQQLTESHSMLMAMNKQQLEILQVLNTLPVDQEQRMYELEQKLDEVLTRRTRRRASDTARATASTNHVLAPGDYQLLHLPVEGDGV